MLIPIKQSEIKPGLLLVNLQFQQMANDDYRTSFKFVDCLATIEGTDDYLGGLCFGGYEIVRRNRRFLILPGDFLTAVDQAIDYEEMQPEYFL